MTHLHARMRLGAYAVAASLLFILTGIVHVAQAAYGRAPQVSHVDPSIMRIDEQQYLGVSVAKDYALVDSNGREFTLGDMLGKPLVLVFAYYECDGACPTIAKNLKRTLEGIRRWRMGKDFQVLTVSFNRQDTPEKLAMFLHHAGFDGGLPEGWRMATLKSPDDIERITGTFGYKFFWEVRDRMFLHPAVYIMLSPEGRATRFLYGNSITAQDMEISITNAYGDQLSVSNTIELMMSACFSYNYEEGKYTFNYPLFVALGSLIFGIMTLLGGSFVMKRRAKV